MRFNHTGDFKQLNLLILINAEVEQSNKKHLNCVSRSHFQRQVLPTSNSSPHLHTSSLKLTL